MKGWKTEELGKVAPIMASKTAPAEDEVWLLNLDKVESNTGVVLDYLYVPVDSVGTSTCRFDTTNVLYSKLRPYLNKVVIPGRDGYATSEMLPLKPDPDRLTREYLTIFLRSPQFVEYISSKVSGAKMPRANTTALMRTRIPLPSVAEQHSIFSEISKMWKAISIKKQQIEQLDLLIKSRFFEMFGDLASRDCQHKKCKLAEACAQTDDIKCGPFGTQLNKGEYQETGVAVWEIPQINSGFASKPTHFLTSEKAEQLKAYSLIAGDIAMSRKGNVGKCALFPEDYEDGIIHSDVLRIRVDRFRVNSCFMMYQLHFSDAVQHQIALVSSGAIMPGINVTKLKQIEVYLPDYEEQETFAAFVKQVDKSKLALAKVLDQLQLLYEARMQYYFGAFNS